MVCKMLDMRIIVDIEWILTRMHNANYSSFDLRTDYANVQKKGF